MKTPAAQHRLLLFILASLFFTAWGGVGLYTGLQHGFSGGLYDPEYRVPGVVPGSAAERAGFRPGDRVISVDGTAVEQLGMESRWPRSLASNVGQTRRFVVERDGKRLALDYVYPAPPQRAKNNRIGAALVGLGFLIFALVAVATVDTRPAVLFGYIGMSAGVAMAFGLGPSLGWWNGIMGHVSTAASVLMFILLLRFFEIFPKTKPVSESRAATWGIYVPWLGLLAFLVAEVILHPALYYTTGSVAGPLTLVYGILGFAAVVHTLVRTSLSELVASGMAFIVGGILIAIAGMAAGLTSFLDLPSWVYSLALLALPLTMALAVVKQGRGSRAAGATVAS